MWAGHVVTGEPEVALLYAFIVVVKLELWAQASTSRTSQPRTSAPNHIYHAVKSHIVAYPRSIRTPD